MPSRTMLAAFAKGRAARKTPGAKNPYPDRRAKSGRATYLTAYHNAWEDGYRGRKPGTTTALAKVARIMSKVAKSKAVRR